MKTPARSKSEVVKLPTEILDSSLIINDRISRKEIFAKVIIKNAPGLLAAIPGLGSVVSALSQTTISTVIDYWDELASEKRNREIISFMQGLDRKLEHIEIKLEAKDYFENTIIFRFDDIMHKLMSNPGKGFDEFLSEFVSQALIDISIPVDAKDLILSTILEIDVIDIKILKQVNVLMISNIQTGRGPGVKIDVLEAILKTSGIDSIMISRSIQRLSGQDLIQQLSSSTGVIQEQPKVEDLIEGKKSPQHYNPQGFVISAFGRRFLRFLNME